jgi:LysR family transcriptional regulator, hydrogen peroxide-inducible genes activator
MEDISHMRKGKLIVGSLPITGSHILPLVLPVFQSRYPEIEIILVEDTSNRLENLTSNGQTDISLLTLPLHEPSLTYQKLIDEEIWLALPPQHDLLQAKNQPSHSESPWIQISDLKKEPFIVLKKGQGFRQITEELCLSAGFQPNIVFESSNIDTVQSLVAAGMGIAFVPSMIARKQGSPFTPAYLPLQDKPHRTLVIAYRKGRYLSKAAEAFIATLLEVTAY